MSCESELDLRGFLDYAKPDSAILLAGSAAGSATLSPRKMQERRLSLVGAAASSAKDMARMLAFCALHRVRLAHASSELDAEATTAALGALAADPEARQVLVRSALISTWLRANRTGTAVHAAPLP